MKMSFQLLIFIVTQLSFLAISHTENQKAVYSIVVSNGSEKGDQDVVIIKRVDKLFSFKYCRAFTDDQQATPVQLLRAKRFGSAADKESQFMLAEKIYEDNPQYCDNNDNSLYSYRPGAEIYVPDSVASAFSTLGMLTGLISAVAAVGVRDHVRILSRGNNTRTLFRVVITGTYTKFYLGWAIYGLILSGGLEYMTYHIGEQDDSDKQLHSDISIADKNLSYVLVSKKSMISFYQGFREEIKNGLEHDRLLKL